MGLDDARRLMAERGVDGWLVYDFHGANPVFPRVVPGDRFLTRRVFAWVPRDGDVVVLVAAVDAGQFSGWKEGELRTYTHRESLLTELARLLSGARVAAMEYAPGGVLPYASRVDGGTLDLVRGMGVAVVPAGDLYQAAFARLTVDELQSHREAARLLDEAKDQAFRFAFDAVRSGEAITEFDVQSRILTFFEEHGMATGHAPVVAVNANAADPHYAPTADRHAPIRRDDWLLIDLWAKLDRPGSLYADITWVGACAPEPGHRERSAFIVVRDARDAGVQFLAERAKAGAACTGAEVDRVVRKVVSEAELGDYFTHRTGHSLGEDVHADGANIDGYETVDTRALLPGSLFTIEPGVYVPGEFGVRTEIDVWLGPDGIPEVTTRAQREVLVME